MPAIAVTAITMLIENIPTLLGLIKSLTQGKITEDEFKAQWTQHATAFNKIVSDWDNA